MAVKTIKLRDCVSIDNLVNLPFDIVDADGYLIPRIHDEISRRFGSHENSPIMLKMLEERNELLTHNYNMISKAHGSIGETKMRYLLTRMITFEDMLVQILVVDLCAPLHDCYSRFRLYPMALVLSEDFKTWKEIVQLDAKQCGALEEFGIISGSKSVTA